jgi:hypothetical protein
LSFENFARVNGREVGISTDRSSNEGRFILGIPKGHEHNCEFTLLKIDQHCKCFIFASKIIKPGDILYAYYGNQYEEVAKSFVFIPTVQDMWPYFSNHFLFETFDQKNTNDEKNNNELGLTMLSELQQMMREILQLSQKFLKDITKVQS